eukprot:CAMPEP_0117689316 /NCGR_PEP_ID=MMETSP0804-20121206/24412_1 /TAXON_ID=1074897 /ORGANISM="Tetraselmis astigmatica, Strain CCMP880" /LENGTH=93 /DNA_ID=CAMNT_0005502055 /DNA_START=1396 /DNA_END=1677 /DNA_ORIENTATION=+
MNILRGPWILRVPKRIAPKQHNVEKNTAGPNICRLSAVGALAWDHSEHLRGNVRRRADRGVGQGMVPHGLGVAKVTDFDAWGMVPLDVEVRVF